MRFKVKPEDFVVEELAQLPLAPGGDFALYRVEKRNVTTLQVQADIAGQLRQRSSDVQAPALKDRKSTAIQYLTVKGTGPGELEGPGYRARFVGRCRRPLRPSDLKGNRFELVVRDLSPSETGDAGNRVKEIARWGLPNYFDEQRFGSFCIEPDAPDRFIGKTILRRDAEGAVRAYLAYVFRGDPRPVRAFKRLARQHWGQWAFLLEQAPRPSNYRSLLTYLKDHPQDFRKALNLIPRRLLSLFLAAYQSYLWNQIAAGYLAQVLPSDLDVPTLKVLDLVLPVYRELPDQQHAALCDVSVPLPSHQAVYACPEPKGMVDAVLAAEGLALNDLKARILRRAYLPKGRRPLLLHPTEVHSEVIEIDDRFPGRKAMRLSFVLPPGTYATLVLKGLKLAADGTSRRVQPPVQAQQDGDTATEVLEEV
jgi:tRNA pseudouridine13 synthase